MELPIPMFNPKLHKLDTSYKFCGECRQLFPEHALTVRRSDNVGLCDGCAGHKRVSKRFFAVAASALLAVALAIPTQAQNTTTDHTTTCSTDANDTTVCETAPNYAAELEQAQEDNARRQEETDRWARDLDRAREQGDKLYEPKQTKQKSNND